MLKRFGRFALPSVLSMWVFAIYSMIDGIFVARGVGPDALAAVNLSLPFINLLFAVGLMLGIGASTVISIILGTGQEKEANGYFNQNIIVSSLVGLAITVAALAAIDPLARFLGAAGDNLAYTKEYLGITCCFAAFFIVSYNFEVMAKVDGSPHISAIGVLSCGVMNLVLDYLFVIKLGWGVKGCALATGLAQMTSTSIFVVYFFTRGKKLKFGKPLRKLSIYRRMLPIGLPDGITELSNGIIIFLFNQVILREIGDGGIVSYTVVSYINTLAFMTMTGLGQGTQPLISLCHGMGDRKGCHRYLKYAALSGFALSAAFFLLAQFGAESIVCMFFGPESGQLFTYTIWALRVFSCTFLLTGANVIASAFFTAIEKPRFSLAISLGRGLVFLSASLFGMTAVLGELGIWLSPAVSEAASLIVSGVLVYRYMYK